MKLIIVKKKSYYSFYRRVNDRNIDVFSLNYLKKNNGNRINRNNNNDDITVSNRYSNLQ